MAIHCSILAWKVLWATVHGVARVRHDLVTKPPPRPPPPPLLDADLALTGPREGAPP